MMWTVPIVQIILSCAVMTLSCYGGDCSNCSNYSVCRDGDTDNLRNHVMFLAFENFYNLNMNNQSTPSGTIYPRSPISVKKYKILKVLLNRGTIGLKLTKNFKQEPS